MTHLTGECQNEELRFNFNRIVKYAFRGSIITTDAGLLVFRELDDALGLTEMAGDILVDKRSGKNYRHTIVNMLRQVLLSYIGGYEDSNDAERLAYDPAMRWSVGGNAVTGRAASRSQMARFVTEVLASDENMAALAQLLVLWNNRVQDINPPLKRIVLDMDSSDSPVHGKQEGAAYNTYYRSDCYHPQYVFNHMGDVEGQSLRPGNVYSSDGCLDVLMPVIERYKARQIPTYFRADSAYALPELYEYLEANDSQYAISFKSNPVIEKMADDTISRPVGRPTKGVQRVYKSIRYQAKKWNKARRVVVKAEWRPGKLFPDYSYYITNMRRPAESIVDFYNKRGTAEQWIKEGKHAIKWTRMSCKKFRSNEARHHLYVLAYNMANYMRRLVLPKEIKPWTLTTIREKLVKIGARVVTHGRYYIFQMAEVAISRTLFRKILERIDRLRGPPPVPA